DLAVDLRSARTCVLVLFESEATRAVAQHEAVAVLVPGPACRLRVVVSLRERASGAETAESERRDSVLRSARVHHVRIAALYEARSQADAMRRRRTRRDDRKVRPRHAVHDGDMARDHIDDARRNEERRDPSRAAVAQLVVVAFDRG